MIMNVRKLELDIVFPAYPSDVPRYQNGDWQRLFAQPHLQHLFTPINKFYSKYTVKATQEKTVNRILSTSVIVQLPEERRKQIEQQVLNLLVNVPKSEEGTYDLHYENLVAHTFKKE